MEEVKEEEKEIELARLGDVRVVEIGTTRKLQLLRSGERWVNATKAEIYTLSRSVMYGEFVRNNFGERV